MSRIRRHDHIARPEVRHIVPVFVRAGDERPRNQTRLTQSTQITATMLQETRPSPSFSRSLPIRSAAASSRASRSREGSHRFRHYGAGGGWQALELLKEIAPRVARVAFGDVSD
jgi:hypothetical protein